MFTPDASAAPILSQWTLPCAAALAPIATAAAVWLGTALWRERRAREGLRGENTRAVVELEARTRELASQSALLERLIANAPAAIAHLDHHLRVHGANPEFARLCGRPVDSLHGRPLAEVLPGADETLVPCLRRADLEARAQGFRLSFPDAPRPTHWDLTCCALAGRDGLADGYLLLAVDATERVENEHLQREKIEALEQADATKDQFLAILSHELRTPINAVTGFGSILQDELMGSLTPGQHELLAKMLVAADGLLDMVNDLLEMTFIQAGRVDLAPGPIAFGDLLRHVAARYAPRAHEKEIAVALDIADALPIVSADDLRVEQALGHLVSNAIKFTPARGAIQLRAYGSGESLVCEVEDTGEGIEPEALPKLFKRFTQLDMSSTRRAGGFGIGLGIAKALVEAHGGTIGVRSHPGSGSVFWFTLPAQPCAVPQSS